MTPSINHTNYSIPCNIYDNAANDTLIASISQVFWWSDTQIRKKQVSFCVCSHSIHHHLAFVYDKCYIYFSLYLSSQAHVKSGFSVGNQETRQHLLLNTIILIRYFILLKFKLYKSATKVILIVWRYGYGYRLLRLIKLLKTREKEKCGHNKIFKRSTIQCCECQQVEKYLMQSVCRKIFWKEGTCNLSKLFYS